MKRAEEMALPNPSFHKRGNQGPERRSDLPKAPQTVNVGTELAQGLCLPICLLPTAPHCNFTTLNHGSLRALSVNYFKPEAPL